MGVLRRRSEQKRELGRAQEWSEAAYKRLFDEGGRSGDVRVRRVAQSAALGAAVTIANLRMTNSPLHFSEDEGSATIEAAARRAQWAIGIVQVRLVAREDVMDDIMEACIGHIGRGDLGRDVTHLWRDYARDGASPAPGESFSTLVNHRWFMELAAWIIQGAVARDGKPVEQCLMTAAAQLVIGCTESVAIYSGKSV